MTVPMGYAEYPQPIELTVQPITVYDSIVNANRAPFERAAYGSAILIMKKVNSGGGWPAVWYTWRKAREAGGILKLWRAMRSKNACKTCALGMGGQRGGMVNELGHFPEVCKKSLQAMVADMQGAIQSDFWRRFTPRELQIFSPRELESCGRLVEPVLYNRESGRYTPISWESAFDKITTKLRATVPDETFWYFSGRSSNE